MKEYPQWQDFDIDEVMYGIGAPFVGIGVYTFDRKFSWPDASGTRKEEYESWVKHITEQGYTIPKGYENAYFDLPLDPQATV